MFIIKVLNLLIRFPNNKYHPNNKNYLRCLLFGEGGTFSIRGRDYTSSSACFLLGFHQDHQANWWETNSRRRQWQNVKEYIERVWHCQFVPLLNPGSCELALNSEWFERMYTSTAHKTDIEGTFLWSGAPRIQTSSFWFDANLDVLISGSKAYASPSFRFLQTHENNVLPITWITQWQNLSRG